MKITPLTTLAAARVPALTDLFSDVISLTSMAVVASGLTTLTATAAHGIPVGSIIALAVVDALTPNPITAWLVLNSGNAVAPARSGDVLITVGYPHALTTTPDPALYNPWNEFATFTGTGVIDGSIQLVDAPSSTTLVIRPGAVTLPGSIPGTAVLLERLERELIGWKAATATSKTVLTFVTPASIARNFTVANPKAVKNIRVWGAVDVDHALSHFTRKDEADVTVLDQSYLFVLPATQTRISRDRDVSTDAMAEITPNADFRLTLIDGFELLAILPAERYGGAVGCVDKCQGPIFTAMLLTFNGLSIPRSEINVNGSDYVAVLTDHGCIGYNKANYWHSYRFELIAQLTNQDRIQSIDTPDIAAVDVAIQNGSPIPTDPIALIGSVPAGTIAFGPDPTYGIKQQGQPSPLVAQFTV